jgi:hypothetical protein
MPCGKVFVGLKGVREVLQPYTRLLQKPFQCSWFDGPVHGHDHGAMILSQYPVRPGLSQAGGALTVERLHCFLAVYIPRKPHESANSGSSKK